MQTAKAIMLTNVKALCQLIRQYDTDTSCLEQYFDSWDNKTWPIIEDWLVKLDHLRNQKAAIRQLAHALVSDFSTSLLSILEKSFVIHEKFWNVFFINVLKAKSILMQQR